MKLLYQGVPGAYSNLGCLEAEKNLDISITDIQWLPDFKTVWENIWPDSIWVIPVENSYAWNIHENIYNFLRYDFKVIWIINLEINHCLLSKETDISEIKEVYSHPQALSQCHDYLIENNIKPIIHNDTAWSAEMVAKNNASWVAAIASSLASDIYNLNIVEKSIQDQSWNTTRFFLVAPKNSKIKYSLKKNKTSIIFEAKNIASSLYKCLWAFATNNVNLTKIESLPSLKDPFTYLFWLDFEWTISDKNVINSLEELEFFTKSIKILWEY
jgi:prephenate dehydratase